MVISITNTAMAPELLFLYCVVVFYVVNIERQTKDSIKCLFPCSGMVLN